MSNELGTRSWRITEDLKRLKPSVEPSAVYLPLLDGDIMFVILILTTFMYLFILIIPGILDYTRILQKMTLSKSTHPTTICWPEHSNFLLVHLLYPSDTPLLAEN